MGGGSSMGQTGVVKIGREALNHASDAQFTLPSNLT